VWIWSWFDHHTITEVQMQRFTECLAAKKIRRPDDMLDELDMTQQELNDARTASVELYDRFAHKGSQVNAWSKGNALQPCRSDVMHKTAFRLHQEQRWHERGELRDRLFTEWVENEGKPLPLSVEEQAERREWDPEQEKAEKAEKAALEKAEKAEKAALEPAREKAANERQLIHTPDEVHGLTLRGLAASSDDIIAAAATKEQQRRADATAAAITKAAKERERLVQRRSEIVAANGAQPDGTYRISTSAKRLHQQAAEEKPRPEATPAREKTRSVAERTARDTALSVAEQIAGVRPRWAGEERLAEEQLQPDSFADALMPRWTGEERLAEEQLQPDSFADAPMPRPPAR
jgi:hypothetical protein